MASELRTESVFDALKQPLALIESDERRRSIETYVEAARTPLERAVFDLMSQMARAIDERSGGDGDEAQWSALEGDVEKITIRIPAELKDLAQQAASRAGTSANTWFIKALARAVKNIDVPAAGEAWRDERRPPRRGQRLSGWIGGDDE